MIVVPDGWTWEKGVGFLPLQTKEHTPVRYDKAYFSKYVKYSLTDQGSIINRIRTTMITGWIAEPRDLALLDVGIGCGSFLYAMRSLGWAAYGADVNPVALDWLDKMAWGWDKDKKANILTFWDVLEHITTPALLFKHHNADWIFMSMPIYIDENHVFVSKHFRPGEHCWYFTEEGIIRFMLAHGYECVEINQKEMFLGGREDIYSFVFRKLTA